MDSVSVRSGYLKSAELCEIEMRRPHFSNASTLNVPSIKGLPGYTRLQALVLPRSNGVRRLQELQTEHAG